MIVRKDVYLYIVYYDFEIGTTLLKEPRIPYKIEKLV